MYEKKVTKPKGAPFPRIDFFDVLRGFALIAMILYHFTWDLQHFNLLPIGTIDLFGWQLFARAIASSFLILVGVSLYLAHGNGFRKNIFIKRFLMTFSAACLITIATYFAMPQRYIFFGILHCIAFSSVLALLVLRLSAPITLALAFLILYIGVNYRFESFNAPSLYWLGLNEMRPDTNDYEPLFPWLSAVFFGVALGQLMEKFKILPQLAKISFEVPIIRPIACILRFLGRNSLITYLLHQPILFGAVFAIVSIFGLQADERQVFVQNCLQNCQINASKAQCEIFCPCILQRFEENGNFGKIFAGEIDLANDEQSQSAIDQCSIKSRSSQ